MGPSFYGVELCLHGYLAQFCYEHSLLFFSPVDCLHTWAEKPIKCLFSWTPCLQLENEDRLRWKKSCYWHFTFFSFASKQTNNLSLNKSILKQHHQCMCVFYSVTATTRQFCFVAFPPQLFGWYPNSWVSIKLLDSSISSIHHGGYMQQANPDLQWPLGQVSTHSPSVAAPLHPSHAPNVAVADADPPEDNRHL